MKRGKFIVFEGIDGSGKSTHAALLKTRLEEMGEKVFLTAEPSDGEAGKLLRRCLRREAELPEEAIAGLFMTDRLDHIKNPKNGILSHLEKGETVLCDRYYFSSFAYNGNYAPLDWVMEINALPRALLRPDITLFLDIPPERFLERSSDRAAIERYEEIELLSRVRNNYFSVFRAFPDENVAVIDNDRPIALTAESIYRAVEPLFKVR